MGVIWLQDAVTDMSAESDPLEMVENAKGHRGILQAAKYIKDQLLGRGILEAAFQQAQVNQGVTALAQQKNLKKLSFKVGTIELEHICSLKDSYCSLNFQV